jgi:hypothetical protein
MIAPGPNCFTEFTDGLMRPVFVDAPGQYVIDDDGEPADGHWYIPREECDVPLIVDARRGLRSQGMCGRYNRKPPFKQRATVFNCPSPRGRRAAALQHRADAAGDKFPEDRWPHYRK